MPSSINQAMDNFYTISKRIVNSKERYLYCNALDRLANGCKAETNDSYDKLELIEILFCDVLILVFDDDPSIQTRAITAVDSGISHVSVSVIRSSKHWNKIKTNIINNYGPRINKLRANGNRNWHVIWCLLIRILDHQILKGSSTINIFLSVVENAFRSSEDLMRAEAFLCWRLLISIFFQYNELLSVKRLKLLSVPLKSCQCQSAHTAEIKFRVWWYLINCIDNHITDHVHLVLQPFLVFCYGSSSKSIIGAAQQYYNIQQLALPCFVTLLCEKRDTILHNQLMEFDLETLNIPSPLMSLQFLKEQGTFVLNISIIAINLFIATGKKSISVEIMIKLLLQRILKIMNLLDSPSFNISFLTEISCMKNINYQALNIIFDVLANEHFGPLKTFASHIKAITNLIVSSTAIVPAITLHQCIQNIYSIQNLRFCENRELCFETVLETILDLHSLNTELCSTVLQIWSILTNYILEFCHEKDLSLDVLKYEIFLKKWTLWPLHNYKFIDNTIFVNRQWEKLLMITLQSKNKKAIVKDINDFFSDCVEIFHSIKMQFLRIYVSIIHENCGLESVIINDIFALLRKLTCLNNDDDILDLSINSVLKFINHLSQEEIENHSNVILVTIDFLWNIMRKSGIDTAKIVGFRTNVLRQIKKSDNLLIQIKAIFNMKEEPVSIWKLSREKLTEEQNEIVENSNVPCLYYDISQLQKSPISLSTPKQIIAVNTQKQNDTKESTGTNNHTTHQIILDEKLNLYNNVKSLSKQTQKNNIICINKHELSIKQNKESHINVEKSEIHKMNFPNEHSPTRTISLSSPDRNLMNNSPSIRRKSNEHLTGRGAQLINMIRNRKLDPSNYSQVSYVNSVGKEIDGSSNFENQTQRLVSKNVHTVESCPSVSILKRKRHIYNMDCAGFETSALKKKRVSFHDPPVSTTKEYNTEDENHAVKPKRFLQLNKVSKATSIGSFSVPRGQKEDASYDVPKGTPEPYTRSSMVELNNLSSIDPNIVMNFIRENFSLDAVLQSFYQVKTNIPQLSITLAKFLSTVMVNATTKSKILEILAEQHPKAFLDHAIQENLSYIVCDRLNLNSILEYIYDKSKVNRNYRNKLLTHITDIISNYTDESDVLKFIKNIFQSYNLNDENILTLISMLMKVREKCKENNLDVIDSS